MRVAASGRNLERPPGPELSSTAAPRSPGRPDRCFVCSVGPSSQRCHRYGGEQYGISSSETWQNSDGMLK